MIGVFVYRDSGGGRPRAHCMLPPTRLGALLPHLWVGVQGVELRVQGEEFGALRVQMPTLLGHEGR